MKSQEYHAGDLEYTAPTLGGAFHEQSIITDGAKAIAQLLAPYHECSYEPAKISEMQPSLTSKKWKISDKLGLEMTAFARLVRVSDDSESMPAGDTSVGKDDLIREQAMNLEQHIDHLSLRFNGLFVVFHNGCILSSGRTREEAITLLSQQQRKLPFVLRKICVIEEHLYMGGPKED